MGSKQGCPSLLTRIGTFLLLLFLHFLFIKGLDVLVHSAGIVVNGSTIDLPVSEYDRCMNINARSAFILTKECLPHLLKTKGNIVHVSSVTGNLLFQ